MIRVSKLTDYGVVLLTSILRGEEGAIHNARELSEKTQVPLPMVSKILKKLGRAGLLLSHRGTKGGYSLARNPEEITLTEVITALEGPIAMTQCVSLSEVDCERQAFCPMCNGWEIVNEAVLKALDGVSLARLCRGYRSRQAGPVLFGNNGNIRNDQSFQRQPSPSQTVKDA